MFSSFLTYFFSSFVTFPFSSRPSKQFFRMVCHSKRLSPWSMYPNFRLSSISILPSDGLSSPHKMERIVDFPQPLGPTIAINSPCFKLKEKLSTASVSDSIV